VKLVEKHKHNYGLNTCLAAIGLPKSTWYYQNKEKVSYEKEVQSPKGTDNASGERTFRVWIPAYPT